MGARTKYTPPVVRLVYIYKPRSFSHCSEDMATRNSSIFANSFEIASRADAGFISRTFHCAALKGEEGKTVGIVPSDMALLNFSLSGKRSRINAMD